MMLLSLALDIYRLCICEICLEGRFLQWLIASGLFLGIFLFLSVRWPSSVTVCVSLCLSVLCTVALLFCFLNHLQRFEGFRNDKTMPPSLEPSCSGATGDGAVTTNHLRWVTDTHSTIRLKSLSGSSISDQAVIGQVYTEIITTCN